MGGVGRGRAGLARGCAWAAFGLGIAYAGVSLLWALGGTWLLDTVGGALEREGRAGNPALLAVLWTTVLLKVVAAGLGVAVVVGGVRQRLVVVAAWTAAVVLTLYGGLLTVVGLLVQADVIPASDDADHRALAWHAYVWDPWFLVWGVVLWVALRLRAVRRCGADPGTSRRP